MKVGIIGTSFAKDAYLPAFAQVPDVEVIAISSGKLVNAQSVATQFNIPHAYDNWREMISSHPLDIVCIVTPPVYHAEMVLTALQAGTHVICEKPTAMNADEARQMYEAAEKPNVVHMMGHELRFNPNRRKIKELIETGYIGDVRHINILNIGSSYGSPASRPYQDWWAMSEFGGGRLGANGSHQIDLLRFWLGEIGAISGQLATMVPNRIGKDNGEPWTATADDQVSFTAEMKSGALATVFLSGVARHNMSNRVEIYGSEGTIRLTDADEKLLVARAGEEFQDMTRPDPNASLPGINKGIWNIGFVALIQEFTTAIRERRYVEHGSTFWDGLENQLAMDAIKQSSSARHWINLS